MPAAAEQGKPRDELIARLEAVAGPSRELDFDIACAVDFKIADDLGFREYAATYPKFAARDNFPAYTASIDAALTLVPDDMGYEIGIPVPPTEARPHGRKPWADLWWEIDGPREFLINAATPAIALCIAALKARAQQ